MPTGQDSVGQYSPNEVVFAFVLVSGTWHRPRPFARLGTSLKHRIRSRDPGRMAATPTEPTQVSVDVELRKLELEKVIAEIEGTRVANQTAIVKAWPPDALADRLIAIGLGALGAGGVAYVALGYPGIEPRTLPTLASWIVGVPTLLWGLARLKAHTETRLNHFEHVFKVESAIRTWGIRGGRMSRFSKWVFGGRRE